MVVKIQVERVRPSGIILPDTMAQGLRGTVVATGMGRRNEFNGELLPPFAAVGDEVFIARASGQELTLDDQSFVLCKNTDVLCILEPVKESAISPSAVKKAKKRIAESVA